MENPFDVIIKKLNEIETDLQDIKQKMSCNHSDPAIEIMNIDEASKFLNMSKSTLYSYTSKQIIPFIKRNNKKICFKKADLIQWLNNGKIQSIEEIKKELANERI